MKDDDDFKPKYTTWIVLHEGDIKLIKGGVDARYPGLGSSRLAHEASAYARLSAEGATIVKDRYGLIMMMQGSTRPINEVAEYFALLQQHEVEQSPFVAPYR